MHCVLRNGGTELGVIEYLPAYGLSALRAGALPILGFEPVRSTLGLRASIPEIEYSASFTDGAPVETGLALAALETMLTAVHRPLSLLLRWECGSSAGSLPLSVLPAWSWPLLPETRLHLATFVLADDGDAAVAGRADAGGVDVEGKCAALYRQLCDRGNIRYETPRVQDEPWSGTAHQAIRPAADILATPSPRDIGASCIDLSILFAAELEARGVNPLLLLTGDRNAPPEHCLVGAWTLPALRFRPLLGDRDALVAHVNAGDLLVWESTGVCAGENADFVAATRRATEALRASAAVQAIDVSAARPPAGRCAPLFVTNAPVVARALIEAQRLAGELGSKRREAAHLLYGACVAGGELTLWLLQRVGTSAAAMAARIHASLPRDGFTGTALPTRNYLTCVSAARANAKHRAATSVNEADLLWALLENPSETVRQIVEAAGCRLSQMQHELTARAERPGEATTHRSIRATTGSPRFGEPQP